MRTPKQAAILCLAVAAVPAAAADDHAPSSLRMREPGPARTRWNIPRGQRVAQAPPDGPQSDAPDGPPPTPPSDPSPTPPSGPPPPTPPADPSSTPPSD